ncbi:MAG: DUF2892 domain-containing protein [Gammaproteobacteria bacterium]|nr:MAG: DUF2892 domain-containing protein [Gammaproteobacteria bacterium]
MLIGTAVIRWCPPYALLGLNTGASKDSSSKGHTPSRSHELALGIPRNFQ